MCGVAGIKHFDSQREVAEAQLQEMTNVLSHRGPDGAGFWMSKSVGLGHRRLSIIDLQTGDQPMHSKDGRVSITFNGEIYNYLEVREELIKLGHQFRTNSDTEVIIEAYLEWGYDCLSKLNGMWAMAIWDDSKQELFISRDRVGEKPLFYSVWDNSFLWGSEIKSLLAYGVPPEPDFSMLEIYLSFGYVPAPYSFYKGVKKLRPGHFLRIRGNDVQETKYWELPELDEQDMRQDKAAIYQEFDSLFRDSVRLRMRSDVPFGAFLSGGLDSSAVVATMAELHPMPVETFTIGYSEKHFDERQLAAEVAAKFGTNHHERIVTPDSVESSLQRVIHHYDEPFGDSSAIPTGYVSAYAREKVKMVLTGDGGDEVLSGYTSYQGEKFAGQYQRLPGFARKGLQGAAATASKMSSGNLRYKTNRAARVLSESQWNFLDRLQSKASWVSQETLTGLLAGKEYYPVKDFLSDFMAKCPYQDPFYKLMYYDFKLSLPEDMLTKVDRMSMARSLETRIPFLDHRLIEMMAHVHKDVKLQGYERKAVLRNSVGRKLPESLLKAPKKGFTVPVREWFKAPDLAEQLTNNVMQAGLVDPVIGKRIIQENATGKMDYGNLVWMLMVLHRWAGNEK